MCRMIAAPHGVAGERIIEPFLRMARGENATHEHNKALGEFNHPDGWGAVYENGGSYESYLSVQSCWQDSSLKWFNDKTIILMHARRASRGEVNVVNVHPFYISHNGKSWYFCHNGTVDDPLIAKYRGGTDSERYFRFLLQHLDPENAEESIEAAVSMLHDYTSLNAFLTDGDQLYLINRFSTSPRYYTLYLHQGPDGPIVASEALQDVATGWTPLKNGSVIAFQANRPILSARTSG